MVLRSEVVPSELLRSFLVIHQAGSYTDAAEILGLTQPAISAQMKRLQQMVGGEVFERGAGGLRLTARGETVKHYASRILNLNWQMMRLCGVGEKCRTYRIGIQNVLRRAIWCACSKVWNAGCRDIDRSSHGGWDFNSMKMSAPVISMRHSWSALPTAPRGSTFDGMKRCAGSASRVLSWGRGSRSRC